jgi:hypothetical protein
VRGGNGKVSRGRLSENTGTGWVLRRPSFSDVHVFATLRRDVWSNSTISGAPKSKRCKLFCFSQLLENQGGVGCSIFFLGDKSEIVLLIEMKFSSFYFVRNFGKITILEAYKMTKFFINQSN